eukprot:CAMPEP_0172089136 /NCGR_PEP_ID=MMETSP1043-20130122/23629_1 /TAXON_ID=464988 /ORGANISM="Hemiselmis andersenii, Strain CCMP441" /LENGTH=104 /DNA_ID=CAMNT_0012751533 /DNA_START=47 /DNA_END=358 /DNA_ORIENTATION=+
MACALLGAAKYPDSSFEMCCISFLTSRLSVTLRSFLISSSVRLSSSSPSTLERRNPSLNFPSPIVLAQACTSAADQSLGYRVVTRHSSSSVRLFATLHLSWIHN